MSAVMGPIIGMLKTIVAGFAVVVVAYIVALFAMKRRMAEDPRRFRLWRDGLHLLAVVIMALWVWFVATHS